MSRRVKGKIADGLIIAGTVTFFTGVLIGPSPDDALDMWVMMAGAAMLTAACALCRSIKRRNQKEGGAGWTKTGMTGDSRKRMSCSRISIAQIVR